MESHPTGDGCNFGALSTIKKDLSSGQAPLGTQKGFVIPAKPVPYYDTGVPLRKPGLHFIVFLSPNILDDCPLYWILNC